jgi:hypothetical protein
MLGRTHINLYHVRSPLICMFINPRICSQRKIFQVTFNHAVVVSGDFFMPVYWQPSYWIHILSRHMCTLQCCHLKKLICKGTFLLVFICLRSRTRPYPTPPTLHTVYVYSVYSVLIHTGKEGGEGVESWTRKKVRGGTVHKAWSKILTWLTVSPLYKLW